MTEQKNVQTALQIALVVFTTLAAAAGVQINPAAKPADVQAVMREELAPLKLQVADLATAQQAQGLRLAAVELRLAHSATATAAP
jgi:hypothetical protein